MISICLPRERLPFFSFFPNLSQSVGHTVGQIHTTKKKGLRFYSKPLILLGVPKRIRTAVDGVKAILQPHATKGFQALNRAFLVKNGSLVHRAVHSFGTQRRIFPPIIFPDRNPNRCHIFTLCQRLIKPLFSAFIRQK
jgi:hypothetical protein